MGVGQHHTVRSLRPIKADFSVSFLQSLRALKEPAVNENLACGGLDTIT
jgi:hypothetical protein